MILEEAGVLDIFAVYAAITVNVKQSSFDATKTNIWIRVTVE